jgi:2-(1,2-epoxy-1,2-dihydrophenyl)acetyl-CoA isomerase
VREDGLVTTAVPLIDVAGDVATVRLNRPDVGNALDLATALDLRAGIRRLAKEHLRAVVLRAEGRMFCAGGDVRDMAAAPDRGAFVAELAGVLHEALLGLRDLPAVVLALVQGTAAGAGVGLVLAADIALASDRATFVAAYPGVGLSPDCGVSALLPDAVGPRRAALFALTGMRLDAATALDWGLVSEVCPADRLEARGRAVLEALTAAPAGAVREAARLLRAAPGRSYRDQLADEAATIARLAATPEAGALISAFATPTPKETRDHAQQHRR